MVGKESEAAGYYGVCTRSVQVCPSVFIHRYYKNFEYAFTLLIIIRFCVKYSKINNLSDKIKKNVYRQITRF